MNPIDALYQEHVSTRALEDGAIALQRLASWWLSDSAVGQLKRDACTAGLVPPPSMNSGEFLALFERKSPSPVIAAGFAIPLEWREAKETNASKKMTRIDDSCLPIELRKIAKRERTRLAATLDGDARERVLRTGLFLGEGCPDISTQQLTCSSAAAAIAATLRCKLQNFPPNPKVAVTAAIEEFGLQSVAGLQAKLIAAQKLGVVKVLVASNQTNDATQTDGVSIEIVSIKHGAPEEQLRDISAHFDAPPFNGSLAECFAWYHRARSVDQSSRVNFFAKELAPHIVKRLREVSYATQCDTLVLSDTLDFPELALVAAELHAARRVVVIELPSSGSSNSGVSARMKVGEALRMYGDGLEVRAVAIERHASAEAIADQLSLVLTTSDRIGVDLTTGPKDLALQLAAWHEARGRLRPTRVAERITYIRFSPELKQLGVDAYSLLDMTNNQADRSFKLPNTM